MWSTVKDPIDSIAPVFDEPGLNLAFKYFTSTTLTMRLAGIAQINSHITTFNELCNSEVMADIEQVGHKLASWLVRNKIINCIFGPNLHVEVIKQSHIVLSFLAMEGRITSTNMDIIWQAAQLKHCSRPVYDLLAPLVKHLAPTPVQHLYSLLGKLEPREHTEQSLYLVSALIKVIWNSSSNAYTTTLGIDGRDPLRHLTVDEASTSSEPSGMDGSSPEDEEEPSPTTSDGPSPRKQPKCDSQYYYFVSITNLILLCNINIKNLFFVLDLSKTKLEMMCMGKTYGIKDVLQLKSKSRLESENITNNASCKREHVSDEKTGSCSDEEHTTDAETDKSNADETIVIHVRKKKKVVLRRNIRSQQRRSRGNRTTYCSTTTATGEGSNKESSGSGNNESLVNYSDNSTVTQLDDTEINNESVTDKVIVDTLDRVKQEAIVMDQTVGVEVPASETLINQQRSEKVVDSLNESTKFAVTLPRHDVGMNSAESSHDEDDSDIVGVVTGNEGIYRWNKFKYS